MWSQSHVGVSLNSILHVYDDTMKVQGVLAGHIWPHGVRCGEISLGQAKHPKSHACDLFKICFCSLLSGMLLPRNSRF